MPDHYNLAVNFGHLTFVLASVAIFSILPSEILKCSVLLS